VDEGIITRDQQNQLQTKLAAWEAATKPSHTVLYAAIFVVILIVIVVAIVAMRRKKPELGQPKPQA
jgi:subtilase family serine protease